MVLVFEKIIPGFEAGNVCIWCGYKYPANYFTLDQFGQYCNGCKEFCLRFDFYQGSLFVRFVNGVEYRIYDDESLPEEEIDRRIAAAEE